MSRSIEFTGPGERVVLRKRCLARPGEYVTPVKRDTLQSVSRTIVFIGPGERLVLRKRCLARSGEYVTPVKRDTL